MEASNSNLNNQNFFHKIWTNHKGLALAIGILFLTCCGIPGLLGMGMGIFEMIYGASPDSKVVERVQELETSASETFSPIDVKVLAELADFRDLAVSVGRDNSYQADYQSLVLRIEKLLKNDIDGFKRLAEKDSSLLKDEDIDLLDGFGKRYSRFGENDAIAIYAKPIRGIIEKGTSARENQRRVLAAARKRDRLRSEFERLVKGGNPPFEELNSIVKEIDILIRDLKKASEDPDFRKEAEGMLKTAEERSLSLARLVIAGPEPKVGGQLAVRSYLRQNLNDYDSSEFLGWSELALVTVEGQPLWTVTLRLRAKNMFGGLIVKTATFYIAQEKVVAVEGL